MLSRVVPLLSAFTIAACTGQIVDPNLVEQDRPDAGPDPRIDAAGDPPADAATTPADARADADVTQQMTVCERWNQDHIGLTEGTWSGDLATCDPGDVSAEGRASALRLVNLYRWLADLPPVTTDPGRDAMAQECALMMHANGTLNHDPPPGWTCYTADGATAAGRSNIATTAGVAAVHLYMVDPGNPNTIGHRRWILSNSLGPVGLGTTSSYSCMWVIGGSGNGGNEWTAYPPPGPFPYQAVQPSFRSIDETGWTLQSNSIDLSGATVTVTDNGEDRPVAVNQLLPNYGSSYAISFIPQGWTTQAGATYHVEVGGIGAPIAYDVEVVDCN